MISTEYGWTDERIFDLPICRLRQIIKTVEERRKAQQKVKNALLEWQTKTLAMFVAHTVQVPKGKSNPLLKAVDKISLNKDEKRDNSAVEADPEVFVEEGSQTAQNHIGSFERVLGGFKEKLPNK